MSRPSFEQSMFALAQVWAERATCPRLHAGVVFCDDAWSVRSSGYNGAPRGLPHCDDVGCLMVDGHCQIAVHAEANGIIQAARIGVSLRDTRVFLTARPCQVCTKMLIQVGVSAIHYLAPYNSDAVTDQVEQMLAAAGIPLRGPYEGAQ